MAENKITYFQIQKALKNSFLSTNLNARIIVETDEFVFPLHVMVKHNVI